jgi:hypothetical protein
VLSVGYIELGPTLGDMESHGHGSFTGTPTGTVGLESRPSEAGDTLLRGQ